MSYDLTALLTTVAASSASFVAILGGFIASKLISISGERDAVLSKLNEIDEQKKFKEAELTKLRSKLKEQAALAFIKTNIQALVERKNAEEVYQVDIPQDISLVALTPYWTRALKIVEDLANAYTDNENVNEDDLPIVFSKKYHNDDFAYSIGLRIEKWYQEQEQRRQPYSAFIVNNLDYSAVNTIQNVKDEERIKELDLELKWLQLQRYQLVGETIRLAEPKGIKKGLILFVVFSLLCIVLPLALTTIQNVSQQAYWLISILMLGLFTVGVLLIFKYLAFLLKWKERSKY